MTDGAYYTMIATLVGILTSFVLGLLQWWSQKQHAKQQQVATESSANSSMADATESLTKSASVIAETMQKLLGESQSARKNEEQARLRAEDQFNKLTHDYNELISKFDSFKREYDFEKERHVRTMRDFRELSDEHEKLKIKLDALEKRNTALEADNQSLRGEVDLLKSQINGTKPLESK